MKGPIDRIVFRVVWFFHPCRRLYKRINLLLEAIKNTENNEKGSFMMMLTEMETSDQRYAMEKATNWYYDHEEHVLEQSLTDDEEYPPSGRDVFHPELWKAPHWKWFMIVRVG